MKSDDRSRLHDSLESALKLSDGLAIVAYGEEEILFSSNYACKYCGFSIPKLEPKLFSFNAPFGACPECKGLGFTQKVDIDYLIPDRSKSIAQGGIVYYKNIVEHRESGMAAVYGAAGALSCFDVDTPIGA